MARHHNFSKRSRESRKAMCDDCDRIDHLDPDEALPEFWPPVLQESDLPPDPVR